MRRTVWSESVWAVGLGLALVAVAFGGFLLTLLSMSGSWPLLDPDESLFALVSEEMAASGQWLVPTYQGSAFHDRPAPYYWVLQGSTWLVGKCEAAYRFPNLLFGFGSVLAAMSIASRLFGRPVGAATAFCLLTMPGLLGISLSVGHDAPLLFFVTASIAIGTIERQRIFDVGRVGTIIWTIAFALCLTGGFLSKGFLGLVLPAIGLVPIRWAMGFTRLRPSGAEKNAEGPTKRVLDEVKSVGACGPSAGAKGRRNSLTSPTDSTSCFEGLDRRDHFDPNRAVYSGDRQLTPFLAGYALAGVLGGGWYLASEFASPGYLWYFLYERHVLGFLTSTQRHGGQGKWVYVVALLLGGFPWFGVLLARMIEMLRTGGIRSLALRSPRIAAVAAWSAGTVLLFAAAGSANPTYLLPAFPPIAILSGVVLERWVRCGRCGSRWADRLVAASPVGLLLVICVGVPSVLIWFGRPWWSEGLWCAAGVVGLACGWWIGIRRGWSDCCNWSPSVRLAWIAAHPIFLSVLLLFAARWLLPEVGQERSARSMVERVRMVTRDRDCRVLWFNGAPASARYYGGDLAIEDVYFWQLQEAPVRPTVLVARRSRREEVETAPFVRGSRWVDSGGRYQMWICGESR